MNSVAENQKPAVETGANLSIINQVGKTAFIIACWREQENQRPACLFNDHVANIFLSPDAISWADQITNVSPGPRYMVVSRTCYFDQRLTQQIEKGVKQVIIMGAGLDTRSIRFGQPGVSFFEVDQKEVLGFKRQQLKDYGYKENASYTACNYISQDVIQLLSQTDFDFDLPTYIIWEGNSMYIPIPEIEKLFKKLKAAIKNLTISFDYVTDELLKANDIKDDTNAIVDEFHHFGADWITGWDDVSELANNTGFQLIENFPATDFYNEAANLKHGLDSQLFAGYQLCTLRA